MEVTINEMRVVMKERLTAREAWPVLQIIRRVAGGEAASYEDEVAMMRACIVEWAFPGEPGDVEAYGDLDAFREFVPLSNAVGQHLRTLVLGNLPVPAADADMADQEPIPKN